MSLRALMTVAACLSYVGACKSMRSPVQSAGMSVDSPQGPEARLDTSYHEMGVHPDCTEKPITYDQLVAIAQDPQVRHQQDFLDRLRNTGTGASRNGVMQTFTLLYESESAQQPAISAEWPGVIRMTQDGRLVIRYVCQPDVKGVSGKVEVIRYDANGERFRLSELDFNQPPGQRLREDPKACQKCHRTRQDEDDPRPNWAMYPDWGGVFGSHDDFFPKGTKEEAKLVHHFIDHKKPENSWITPNMSDEKDQFDTFMKGKVKAASGVTPDPCYASLPWPEEYGMGKPVPAAYVNYPYGTSNGHAKDRIYALRPNLKLTEVQSHLLGRRNFRKISALPDYGKVKFLLAYEGARCMAPNSGAPSPWREGKGFHAALKNALPAYKRQAVSKPTVELRGEPAPHHDPRHPKSLAQGLYGTSLAMGFVPNDWTLEFLSDMPGYETGAGPGRITDFEGDLPVTAYVQHEILADVLREMGDKLPDGTPVNTLIRRSTGESDDFGAHFICIDRNAGGTEFLTAAAQEKVCAALAAKVGAAPQNATGSK